MNINRTSYSRTVKRLFILAAVLLVICIAGFITLGILSTLSPAVPTDTDTDTDAPSNNGNPSDNQNGDSNTPADNKPSTPSSAAILQKTDDAGMSYVDKLVFLGESTTAHLVHRGNLTGGRDTKQVWSGPGNTLMLSTEIATTLIKYPETGEEIALRDAIAQKKPEYLVITLGLNGIMGFQRNNELFNFCYQKLIDTVKEQSPNTKIIIQSEFPLTRDCKEFSESASVVNGYIKQINSLALKLAEKNGLKYLDTASVLMDEEGFLKSEYDNGDGLHISEAGYTAIIGYIRTHAYK